jgi:hypothetical protein
MKESHKSTLGNRTSSHISGDETMVKITCHPSKDERNQGAFRGPPPRSSSSMTFDGHFFVPQHDHVSARDAISPTCCSELTVWPIFPGRTHLKQQRLRIPFRQRLRYWELRTSSIEWPMIEEDNTLCNWRYKMCCSTSVLPNFRRFCPLKTTWLFLI